MSAYDFGGGFDSAALFRMGLRMQMGVTRPNMHARISGITERFEHGPHIALPPSVKTRFLFLPGSGRTPLWTRHMAGVRELERDRRRRC